MSTEPHSRPDPEAVNERDPYPRMIIACIAVSMTLFVIISGFMVYDFVARQKRTVPSEQPVVGLPPQPFQQIPVETTTASPDGAGTSAR